MNYTTSANNWKRANELNFVLKKVKFSLAILISLKIAQVSHVTVAGAWTTMMLTKGIEVWAKAITAILIIGKITELMDVKGVFAVRG